MFTNVYKLHVYHILFLYAIINVLISQKQQKPEDIIIHFYPHKVSKMHIHCTFIICFYKEIGLCLYN